MPAYRLRDTPVEAIQIPEGYEVELSGSRLEPRSWLVLRNGKLASFSDAEFQEEFEDLTNPPAGCAPIPPERSSRKKRSGFQPSKASPSPGPAETKQPRKTLANMALEALHSRAMTKQDLLECITAQGKCATGGGLYQACRILQKQGRIIFDPERATFRIPVSAGKRAGA